MSGDERGSSVNSSGYLLHNLMLFARLLRSTGMDVGTDRTMVLLHALTWIDLNNREEFYYATRTLLVSRKEDLILFDAAFEMFWQSPSRKSFRQAVTISGELPRLPRPVILPPSLNAQDDVDHPNNHKNPGDDQPPSILEATATYSTRERLRHKDFAELTPEEMQEIKHLIGKFVWQLGDRRTRRYQTGGEARVDMRRTIRRNLGYGGEMMEWAYRRPLFKPRPLVLIADISGSMDRYTRLLIRFCYSIARGLKQPVEVFVFSTQLTCVTRQLRGRDVDRALAEVGRTVTDWSGGTRIGEAVKTFNYQWGQRVLGRGAVVILISDGWDRGEPDLLHREMARLHRSCYRLIWLNPLLGAASYEPITRGMQAAMPHIDDFLPVHNLASLESLADHLARLGGPSAPWRKHA